MFCIVWRIRSGGVEQDGDAAAVQQCHRSLSIKHEGAAPPLSSSIVYFARYVSVVQRLHRFACFPSKELADRVAMAPAAFVTLVGCCCVGSCLFVDCLAFLVVLDVDLLGFVFQFASTKKK